MKYFKIFFSVCLITLVSCKENTLKEEKTEIKNVAIYSIGDSTMADKPNPKVNPERGWCQILPSFLNDNVTLENHAVNGRSSRSFITEKRWQKVYNKLKKGDYVFIQFGHNDQKENSPKISRNLEKIENSFLA